MTARYTTTLWEMLEFNAARFVRVISLIAGIRAGYDILGTHLDRGALGAGGPYTNGERSPELEADMEALSAELGALDLPASKKSFERIREVTKPGTPLRHEQARSEMRDFHMRLRDELESRCFLALSAAERELFDAKEPPFGAAVADKFAPAAEDIEEAAKCLAVGRCTACVFHLSRAMEAALQVLLVKLGGSNPDREWGKLLSDVNGRIEALPKGLLRDQWSESAALLYHVKQAWRNDVMHPKGTYTEEQAREVFAACRSFMRHLASLA